MPRIVIQLLLSTGVLFFYPFVLLLVSRLFDPATWRDIAGFSLENAYFLAIYLFAAVAVPLLFVSIFVRAEHISRRRWFGYILVSGLAGGCVTSITFLIAVVPDAIERENWNGLVVLLWQIAGPLVVAVWNLNRIRRAGRDLVARGQQAR